MFIVMPDAPAIRFVDVTKSYPVPPGPRPGLKRTLLHLPEALRAGQAAPVTALDGVAFEVRRGECFGLIGRNGSGKSTALGLMAGVLRPTRGAVEVAGRVVPLLELGAGFHPELSGEENLVLNGVLLGRTRDEMRARRDAIVDFAGLGDVIGRPLRTFSSGMIARLGFSVVVHLDPEILIIDEVLAVGDEGFRAKCAKRMEAFRAAGVTLVFVSHDLPAVEALCDRAGLLEGGRLAAVGAPRDVVAEYRRRVGPP
jgi:lipopolysaccharide transport system ATP-binding protein